MVVVEQNLFVEILPYLYGAWNDHLTHVEIHACGSIIKHEEHVHSVKNNLPDITNGTCDPSGFYSLHVLKGFIINALFNKMSTFVVNRTVQKF